MAAHPSEEPSRYASLGIAASSKNDHAGYMREWRRHRRVYRLAEKKVFRARKRALRLGAPKAPREFTASDIIARYKEQNGRCFWCGADTGSSYHIDHLIPLCRGGTNAEENMVVSCQRCNDSKGSLTPKEFRAKIAGLGVIL